MHVTIIRDDNSVSVNGESHTVDCSTLPADFHALQWDGASGEVEYRMVVCDHCRGRNKEPNLRISDLAPYQPYIDAWKAAEVAAAMAKLAAVKAHADALILLNDQIAADKAARSASASRPQG